MSAPACGYVPVSPELRAHVEKLTRLAWLDTAPGCAIEAIFVCPCGRSGVFTTSCLTYPSVVVLWRGDVVRFVTQPPWGVQEVAARFYGEDL
jgi:hypothetical protein